MIFKCKICGESYLVKEGALKCESLPMKTQSESLEVGRIVTFSRWHGPQYKEDDIHIGIIVDRKIIKVHTPEVYPQPPIIQHAEVIVVQSLETISSPNINEKYKPADELYDMLGGVELLTQDDCIFPSTFDIWEEHWKKHLHKIAERIINRKIKR